MQARSAQVIEGRIAHGPLTDRLGRVHTYLRVSVTDRCNYRCVYCMPEEGMNWVPREQLLRYEEIARIVGVFAQLGVTKIRITGGEPTIRSDIESLVAAIAETPGITDVALTTNGHTLARQAERLHAAGLRRINVSLDTLRPDRFTALTRGGDLGRVLAGIAAARAAGMVPVKINAVLLQGENDDEVFDLVDFFGQDAATTELRFIEYMPFEARWHRCGPSADVRRQIASRYTLLPEPREGAAAGPARTWRVAESGLRVGFISPLSEHFCAGCNRLRLMVDGHLRTCLAHEDTPSLRDLLRAGASDQALADSIREMVMGKPDGHDCTVDGGEVFQGVMTGIGG
jgi:cyclic pyranopterin phosphate synthase